MLERLLPTDWQKWIPGRKLLAGLVVYVIAEAFGIDNGVATLPVIGVVNVQELATLVAVYLWPDVNTPVVSTS